MFTARNVTKVRILLKEHSMNCLHYITMLLGYCLFSRNGALGGTELSVLKLYDNTDKTFMAVGCQLTQLMHCIPHVSKDVMSTCITLCFTRKCSVHNGVIVFFLSYAYNIKIDIHIRKP